MQYPPQDQPPEDQPSYPPSEIYQYDQPPQFAPAQEITRPPAQRQDIVVYPNRTQAIMRTIICVICLVFLIGLFAASLILGFATGAPSQASDLAPLFTVLLIFFAAIIFVGWITWRMASRLLRRTPFMIINNEGIRVSKMPMLSGFFISWTEIDAIFVSHYFLYRYFCILPKNPDQFLSRFKGYERFNRRLNSMIGSPLYIPLVFLGKPVEEILQQLYYMYSSELNYYHIQLRS